MHLNIREVSKLLRVSERRVNEWIKRGLLRADRINNQYQFHRSDLLEQTASREIDIRAEIFAASAPASNQAFSLTDAARVGGVHHGIRGAEKSSVLRMIVDTLAVPTQADRDSLWQLLVAREAMGSTAIGDGIAIPHVRRPILFSGAPASISLFFLDQPVDFHAADGKPVFAIFLLISPTARRHLHLLSRLSFALHDSELKAAIVRRASSTEILAEFQRVDEALRQRTREEHRTQTDTPES